MEFEKQGGYLDQERITCKALQVDSKIKVAEKYTNSFNLLAISSKYGYAVIADQQGFKFIPDTAALTALLANSAKKETLTALPPFVQVTAPPISTLNLSTDQKSVILATQANSLLIYHLSSLTATPTTIPLKATVIQLLPNPQEYPDIIALLFNDNSLSFLNTLHQTFTNVDTLPSPVSAICWSTRGKQLACGSCDDGRLFQINTQAVLKNTVEPPPSFVSAGSGKTVVESLNWIENKLFVVVYTDGVDRTAACVVTQDGTPKKTNYINLDDPIYTNNFQDTGIKIYSEFIRTWGTDKYIGYYVNNTCSDLGLLISPSNGNWYNYTFPEPQPVLPLTPDGRDPHVVGFAMDYTNTKRIAKGSVAEEGEFGRAPILWCLLDEGYLLGFYCINSISNEDGDCPGMTIKEDIGIDFTHILITSSEESTAVGSSTANPSTAFGVSLKTSNTEPVVGSSTTHASTTFGAPLKTSTTQPAVGFGSALAAPAYSSSATSAFGNSSAPESEKKPTSGFSFGGGSSTPSFGGSSFGKTAAETASEKPSTFGAALKTSTTQSAVGFGSALAAPAYSSSATSAFGNSSAPESEKKPTSGFSFGGGSSTPSFGGSSFGKTAAETASEKPSTFGVTSSEAKFAEKSSTLGVFGKTVNAKPSLSSGGGAASGKNTDSRPVENTSFPAIGGDGAVGFKTIESRSAADDESSLVDKKEAPFSKSKEDVTISGTEGRKILINQFDNIYGDLTKDISVVHPKMDAIHSECNKKVFSTLPSPKITKALSEATALHRKLIQLLDGGVKQLRDDTDALEVKKGLCINYVDDGGIDGDGQKIDIGLGPEGEDFQSKIRAKKNNLDKGMKMLVEFLESVNKGPDIMDAQTTIVPSLDKICRSIQRITRTTLRTAQDIDSLLNTLDNLSISTAKKEVPVNFKPALSKTINKFFVDDYAESETPEFVDLGLKENQGVVNAIISNAKKIKNYVQKSKNAPRKINLNKVNGAPLTSIKRKTSQPAIIQSLVCPTTISPVLAKQLSPSMKRGSIDNEGVESSKINEPQANISARVIKISKSPQPTNKSLFDVPQVESSQKVKFEQGEKETAEKKTNAPLFGAADSKMFGVKSTNSASIFGKATFGGGSSFGSTTSTGSSIFGNPESSSFFGAGTSKTGTPAEELSKEVEVKDTTSLFGTTETTSTSLLGKNTSTTLFGKVEGAASKAEEKAPSPNLNQQPEFFGKNIKTTLFGKVELPVFKTEENVPSTNLNKQPEVSSPTQQEEEGNEEEGKEMETQSSALKEEAVGGCQEEDESNLDLLTSAIIDTSIKASSPSPQQPSSSVVEPEVEVTHEGLVEETQEEVVEETKEDVGEQIQEVVEETQEKVAEGSQEDVVVQIQEVVKETQEEVIEGSKEILEERQAETLPSLLTSTKDEGPSEEQSEELILEDDDDDYNELDESFQTIEHLEIQEAQENTGVDDSLNGLLGASGKTGFGSFNITSTPEKSKSGALSFSAPEAPSSKNISEQTGFGQPASSNASAPSFGQSNPSTSGFGSSLPAAPTFGQPSTTTGASVFDSASSSPAASASVFGSPGFDSTTTSAPLFGQAPAFGQTSSAPSTTAPIFGQPSTTPSVFGQPSNTTLGFGQSSTAGFGQTSNAPAFGQSTSGFGQGSSGFGGASAFGQSGFGAPSATTPTTSAFGQSGFGTPSTATPTTSAFGQSGFGAPSATTPTTSAFGQSGFGAPSATTPTTSAFGQSGFGTPSATATSAFGQSSSSAFGQAASNNSGFGQSGFGNSSGRGFGVSGFGASGFGAHGNTPSSGFGRSGFGAPSTFTPPTNSGFGSTGFAAAPPVGGVSGYADTSLTNRLSSFSSSSGFASAGNAAPVFGGFGQAQQQQRTPQKAPSYGDGISFSQHRG